MTYLKKLILCSVIFSLIACQSTSHLKQFKGGAVDTLALSEGEKRIWSMADDAEIQIRRSGKILRDAHSKKAIERILVRLFPEHKGNIKITIIKRPILNAFAFPNGSLYIHTGIIAAAKNEHQLAAVIAHEGAHFLFKHGAKSRINQSNMASMALLVNLMGIPLIGELIGISSIMGYSRELEREADLEGAKRMLAAGYDLNEAHKMFEFMASEAKANERDEPFFFATHPKLQERIQNFKQFAEEHKQTTIKRVSEKKFNSEFKVVKNYALHKKLELGRYSSLINELTYDDNLWGTLSLAEDKIVFAEAYRLRGRDGDKEAARNLIKKILTGTPNFWKAYFSLGIIELKEKQFAKAKKYLMKAKSLTTSDNGYINMYLKKLKNSGE